MPERRRAFVEHFAALEKCNTTSIVNNRRPDGMGKYHGGTAIRVNRGIWMLVPRNGSQMEIALKHRLSIAIGWEMPRIDIHWTNVKLIILTVAMYNKFMLAGVFAIIYNMGAIYLKLMEEHCDTRVWSIVFIIAVCV